MQSPAPPPHTHTLTRQRPLHAPGGVACARHKSPDSQLVVGSLGASGRLTLVTTTR